MEVEYVPQKVFDIHLQSIRDKASYEKELTDEKLERFQAVIEKKFSDVGANISDIRGDIKVLDEKIDGVSKRIDGVEKRIEDINQAQNKWFTVFGVLLGVLTVAFSVLAFFK